MHKNVENYICPEKSEIMLAGMGQLHFAVFGCCVGRLSERSVEITTAFYFFVFVFVFVVKRHFLSLVLLAVFSKSGNISKWNKETFYGIANYFHINVIFCYVIQNNKQ